MKYIYTFTLCSFAGLIIQMDTLKNQRARYLSNYYRKMADETLGTHERITLLNRLSDVIAKEAHPAVDEVGQVMFKTTYDATQFGCLPHTRNSAASYGGTYLVSFPFHYVFNRLDCFIR